MRKIEKFFHKGKENFGRNHRQSVAKRQMLQTGRRWHRPLRIHAERYRADHPKAYQSQPSRARFVHRGSSTKIHDIVQWNDTERAREVTKQNALCTNSPWRLATKKHSPIRTTERYRADHPKAYRLQSICARIVRGDSPQKAKTAGCRLRFMLEEKRKGKMKN